MGFKIVNDLNELKIEELLVLLKEGQSKKMLKLQGAGNICPKCGREGYFTSVSLIEIGTKEFLICGWCGSTFVRRKRKCNRK